VQNERLADGVGLRDVGQLRVEHTAEGEQVVALVLQRDAHRTDVPWILGLAGREFRDDKVEQQLPGGQDWSGQGQNVMAQPLGERSDIAGQA